MMAPVIVSSHNLPNLSLPCTIHTCNTHNTTCGRGENEIGKWGVDLQISGAGLVNFVFTKWLRPTYADKKYAIFARNSLNLHLAPVSLVGSAAKVKTDRRQNEEREGIIIEVTTN